MLMLWNALLFRDTRLDTVLPQEFYNYSILSLAITKSNLISSQKYIDLFQPSQLKKDSMSIYIGFIENLIQHFSHFGIGQ